MLGTQPSGNFAPVVVTSIQRAQVCCHTSHGLDPAGDQGRKSMQQIVIKLSDCHCKLVAKHDSLDDHTRNARPEALARPDLLCALLQFRSLFICMESDVWPQVPVKKATAGQHATLAIHDLEEPQAAVQTLDPEAVYSGGQSFSRPATQPGRFTEDTTALDEGSEVADSSRVVTPEATEAFDTLEGGAGVRHEFREASTGSEADFWTARSQADSKNLTDRRHDVWQSRGQYPAMHSLRGRASSSFSGDSDHSESPRYWAMLAVLLPCLQDPPYTFAAHLPVPASEPATCMCVADCVKDLRENHAL